MHPNISTLIHMLLSQLCKNTDKFPKLPNYKYCIALCLIVWNVTWPSQDSPSCEGLLQQKKKFIQSYTMCITHIYACLEYCKCGTLGTIYSPHHLGQLTCFIGHICKWSLIMTRGAYFFYRNNLHPSNGLVHTCSVCQQQSQMWSWKGPALQTDEPFVNLCS